MSVDTWLKDDQLAESRRKRNASSKGKIGDQQPWTRLQGWWFCRERNGGEIEGRRGGVSRIGVFSFGYLAAKIDEAHSQELVLMVMGVVRPARAQWKRWLRRSPFSHTEKRCRRMESLSRVNPKRLKESLLVFSIHF